MNEQRRHVVGECCPRYQVVTSIVRKLGEPEELTTSGDFRTAEAAMTWACEHGGLVLDRKTGRYTNPRTGDEIGGVLHGDFQAAPEAPKGPSQGNAELRERVIEIITKAIAFDGDPERATRDVLAALGLDDLDVAVERMAASLMWGADSPLDEETRAAFRVGLLAALTPPSTASR